MKDLNGKVFGVARVGSADYALSRVVLAKLGVDPESLQYLAVGQPPVRAQALAAGQIDATTISIGVWLSMPDKSSVHEMVDQASFYKAAPFVSKLNVVTEEIAKSKAKQVAAVVRGIILASRDFAKDPKIWVDGDGEGAARREAGRSRGARRSLSQEWSVNGGLNLDAVKFTTETDYQAARLQGSAPGRAERMDRHQLHRCGAEGYRHRSGAWTDRR